MTQVAPAPPDKFILTHRGALLRKYGAAGVQKINHAVHQLIRADARRGIRSQVLGLDSATEMAPYGPPVTAHASPKATKAAIDAIARQAQAHYLMILGGPDVLPLVPLVNPAYSGPHGDPDETVPSDLPYACEAAYSLQAHRFMGPTRVLGRLPDLPGASDPALLLQLLAHARSASARPRSDYAHCFGLSAQAWEQSTRLSLKTVMGHATGLRRAPTQGPRWPPTQLAARVHFINCHGADAAPEFYGQATGAEVFPVAHRASLVRGKISPGTVLAAECCYGAQLYDPERAGGVMGLAATYLQDGACAVFGSTTVAYGPSEGNGSADLICQSFLQQVLAGASTGRAALEARQKFAGGRTHLDPYDLKTLAQFYLLGDPSAHPVAVTAHALTRAPAFKKAFASSGDRTVRGLRREKLQRDGHALTRTLPKLLPSGQAPASGVQQTLQALARDSGLGGQRTQHSFALQGTSLPAGVTRHIHVIQGLRSNPTTATHAANTSATRTRATKPGPTKPGATDTSTADTSSAAGSPASAAAQPRSMGLVALVATEQDGQLLHVRRLHAR